MFAVSIKPNELGGFAAPAPVNKRACLRDGEEGKAHALSEAVHFFGDGNRLAREFEPVGGEPLHHQCPVAHEKQVARRRVGRTHVGIHQQLRLLCVERADVNACGLMLRAGGEIQEMATVRQEMRVKVRNLFARRVERGQWHGRAARSRHAIESFGISRGEDNHAVRVPGAPSTLGRVTQRLHRPARGLNLFELTS